MAGRLRGAVLCILAFLAAVSASSQDEAPGRTGSTAVDDIIAARQALMSEIERLMLPIDLYAVGEPAEAEAMRSAAMSISRMLLATPHLFPPTTNLFDAQAELPKTIAMPAIWENFSGFYALARSATAAADALSYSETPDELRHNALGLRASCDACHAAFMLPYEPPTLSGDEVDLDFDALFDGFDNAE